MKDYEPIQWMYAGWKVLGAIIIVVGSSLPTVVLGWDTMILSGKIVAVSGLGVAAWKSVDLLFDNTMRRISEGKTPIPIPGQNGPGATGDTQHIEKPKT